MRRLILTAVLFPALAVGQGVRVRGVAFDSLSGRPIPTAFITLGSRSTMADSGGRFDFDSIAPGRYRLTMQHDLLDSLGLSGIVSSIDVKPSMDPIRISTPSSQTMWRRVCRGEQPRDSGLVFGVVRDGARKPLADAAVIGRWIELLTVSGTVTQKGWALDTKTGGDGAYVMCGVPVGTGMTLEATRDSALYAGIDVLLTPVSTVRRHDLVVTDLRDSVARGAIRGTITSDGRPVANVHVETDGLPEVVTGPDGLFILRGVRTGTRQLYIQGIGFTPATRIVEVSANDTAQVSITVGKTTVLDSVRVVAKTVRTREADQFNDRRKRGSGYFRDSTEIGKYILPEGVFATMASVQTQRIPMQGLVVTIGGSRARGIRQTPGCKAWVFVDGEPSDFDRLNSINTKDIAAMEVYRSNEMPMDLATRFGFNPFNRPCAVVAWTKNHWRP